MDDRQIKDCTKSVVWENLISGFRLHDNSSPRLFPIFVDFTNLGFWPWWDLGMVVIGLSLTEGGLGNDTRNGPDREEPS